MLAPARAFRETSLSDAVAYAALACVAALSVTLRTTRPRTPTRLRVSGAPDAPGQRDYRSVVDQTSTERRRSALPPLTPFPYHGAWFSRANHEGVPQHVDDLPRVSVSAISEAPVASESFSVDISAAVGESGSELSRGSRIA